MHQPPELNRRLLNELFRFNASLGSYRFFKGIDYVRTFEFPVIAAELLKRQDEPLAYLDVGSGNSILPTFIASRSQFSVTVIDKYKWVQDQKPYLKRLGLQSKLAEKRFIISQEDFLTASLSESSYDLITAVSVLEHIDGAGDSEAVKIIYRLLKPGGYFLMSSPYNHTHPADFYLKKSMYGQEFGKQGAFFQRHYSEKTFQQRIIDSAPFLIENRFYLGHYQKINFMKWFYVLPMPIKLIKVFYNWAAPFYAPLFLELSSEPPMDANPRVTTADTVFAFFRKPA